MVQLVAHDLAKVELAGSSPVYRFLKSPVDTGLFILHRYVKTTVWDATKLSLKNLLL